jgi:hypothetical protein
MPRGGAIALVTAGVSGAVTLAVALSPRLPFIFWQPLAHVALETAAALTVLLAGFLVFARLWRARRLNELLLTCALALLALLNLFFLTVPRWRCHPALIEGRARGQLLPPPFSRSRRSFRAGGCAAQA